MKFSALSPKTFRNASLATMGAALMTTTLAAPAKADDDAAKALLIGAGVIGGALLLNHVNNKRVAGEPVLGWKHVGNQRGNHFVGQPRHRTNYRTISHNPVPVPQPRPIYQQPVYQQPVYTQPNYVNQVVDPTPIITTPIVRASRPDAYVQPTPRANTRKDRRAHKRFRGQEIVKLDRETCRYVQHALNKVGYKAGPVDGRVGYQTRRAIRNFQEDHGFSTTGEMTRRQYRMLQRKHANL